MKKFSNNSKSSIFDSIQSAVQGFLSNSKSSIFEYLSSEVMLISGLSLSYAVIFFLLLKVDFGYLYTAAIDKNIYRLELYDSSPIQLVSLTFIAFIVLVIAISNFINFTISRAPERMKSLNLHLILGAGIKRLRYFIVLESILLSAFSYIISLLFVYLFSLTSFSYLIGGPIASIVDQLYHIGFIMSILVGCLVGIYSARFMLNFQPAIALKIPYRHTIRFQRLKMIVLSFQFILSTILLVLAMFVFLQTRFIHSNDRGFNTDNVIFFKMNPLPDQQRNALSTLLLQNNKIAEVCFSPGNQGSFEIADGETTVPYSIGNQSLADLIGDENDPYTYCFIKLNSKKADVIANKEIMIIIQQIVPGESVEIKKLESHLRSYYDKDEDLSKLINVLCLISLVITMLGLYALMSFHFRAHARSIAIYRVAGAGLPDIFRLFSKEYILTYLISFCVAAPIVFFAIRQWLNNFACKINISIGIFLLAGLFMLFLISGLLYYYTNKIFSLSTAAMIKNK